MTYLFVRVHSAQIAGVAASCFACVVLLAGRSTASLARRTMVQPIYKILADAAYDAAKSEGQFFGTADDLRDGFIHFSAAHQLAGTLAKHFAGQEDLVLLTVDTSALGSALKWEKSRGGDLFPHLYGPLALDAIVAEAPLPLDDDECHILPDSVAKEACA